MADADTDTFQMDASGRGWLMDSLWLPHSLLQAQGADPH